MISFIEKFFTDEELPMLFKEVNSAEAEPKWRTNKFWSKDIVKKSSAVVSLYLSKEINNQFFDLIETIVPLFYFGLFESIVS